MMTDEELRVLAWTILGEAAGEGSRGMEAVAHVIRNRALSGRYPDNPASVALQANASGYYQFSTWNALGQGGNAPRARYPVGSADFNKALAIVQKVFSATPGKDPTQGATHYYAPKGMEDGAAPYWWRSEAKQGEKVIGGHIFATKYDEKVAPMPASRIADPVGQQPSWGQMEVFRTGAPLTLPIIGPTGGPQLSNAPPVPATKSVAMQEKTLSGGTTAGAKFSNYIYDPVTGDLKPKTVSASDLVRAAQRAGAAQPAKTVQTVAKQSVAGFSVPGGIAGMQTVDKLNAYENLKKQIPSYAGLEAKETMKVTQYAAPKVAQPAGSVNPNKGQEQLMPQGPLEFVPQQGMDPVGKMPTFEELQGLKTPAKVAPVPAPAAQRPVPKPVAVPPPTLRVVVQADRPPPAPIAQVIRQPVSKVQQFKDLGMTGAQAYDAANEASYLEAREKGYSSGKGYSEVYSSGGHMYDATTGTWK